MRLKVLFARKVKAFFIRLRCDYLFHPLSNIFLTISYLSKLSKWIRQTEKPVFNDFYARRFDYQKRYQLYDHLIQTEQLDAIDYLEFGVANGHSFKWWMENNPNKSSRFYGFDTFTGLPENWGHFQKGDMSAGGSCPEIEDPRGQFYKGLFQETLPTFLSEQSLKQRKVIHLDADLYSSTLYVLSMLSKIIQKNDILIFDEFNVPLHEFRAYLDFTNAFQIKTELIGCVNNYYQVAFKIV